MAPALSRAMYLAAVTPPAPPPTTTTFGRPCPAARTTIGAARVALTAAVVPRKARLLNFMVFPPFLRTCAAAVLSGGSDAGQAPGVTRFHPGNRRPARRSPRLPDAR